MELPSVSKRSGPEGVLRFCPIEAADKFQVKMEEQAGAPERGPVAQMDRATVS
jgi:hypothetical protein